MSTPQNAGEIIATIFFALLGLIAVLPYVSFLLKRKEDKPPQESNITGQ